MLGILLLFFFMTLNGYSQSLENNNLIQFSGVVITADSLNPVPYTTIIIANRTNLHFHGTISDLNGFFSFVAQRNDTVKFSSIGYKPVMYVIPDTVKQDRYSLIQLMNSDTIYLAETVIYPWPSKEDFKNAFVNLEIPDDEITIGRKNIERAKLKEAAKMYGADGGVNYNYYINQQTSKLYYAGGIASNNYLNPFAWAQFIKAWKEGRFKVNKEEREDIKRQKQIDRQRWDYDEWIEK